MPSISWQRAHWGGRGTSAPAGMGLAPGGAGPFGGPRAAPAAPCRPGFGAGSGGFSAPGAASGAAGPTGIGGASAARGAAAAPPVAAAGPTGAGGAAGGA